MRIQVLYDKNGNVISAAIPMPQTYDGLGPVFGPKAEKDQHVSEFEVPDEHAGLGLASMFELMKVDVKDKHHTLILKS
jgi:hypothetical protein